MILKKRKKTNFSFKILEKFKNTFKTISIIVLTLQLILGLIIIYFYYSSQLYQSYSPSLIFSKLNNLQKKATGFDFENFDDYFVVTIKGIKSKIIGNDLKNVQISVDQKNLLILEKQRLIRQDKLKEFNESDLKVMARGKIGLINEKNFNMRLRVKGVRKLHHYERNYQSYKIDIRGDNRFLGYEELNLQKPITRNYINEYIFHKLQKEVGNIALDYFFVNLSTNGYNNGIYAVEEGIAKELIERHNKRFGPIINTEDSTGEIFPQHTFEARDLRYWTNKNPKLLKIAFSVLNNFREGNDNYENSFDWTKWAKFFAVNDFLGTYHGATSSSVNYYYNPTNGKIEPIGRDAHLGAGTFDNFIILDFITEKNPNCSWICQNEIWFMRFFYKQDKNLREKFLSEYLKTLYYLTNKSFIDKFFSSYGDEIDKINDAIYGEFSKVDKITWKGLAPYVFRKKDIYNRSLMIRNKIDLYENFSSKNINKFIPKISISNNNLYYDSALKKMPIKVSVTCLENSKKFEFFATGRLKKSFNECNNLNKKVKLSDFAGNFISLDVKNNFESIYFIDKFDYKKLPNILDVFEFENIDNNFYLKAKNIYIRDNIYIPEKINIIIKEGTKIFIANNSTIFSDGNLNFNGSKLNKILISGDENLGGSIVQFNGSLKANNLIIKNLSQPNKDEFILYGGLNAINSNVDMNNIYLINSKGEDGINLINSNSKLRNINVFKIKSDGIDIDGGNLNFTKIKCDKIINDCIDISGANFYGYSIIGNNIGDKVVSLGENSNGKIEELTTKNSNIGIAVKDLSNLELSKMVSQNTQIHAAVFIKKNEFGPANLTIEKFLGDFDKKKFLIGKKSTLNFEKNLIIGEIKNKKIRDNLYLN